MLYTWSGGTHSVSIVLDASGMFQNLDSLMGGGTTNTLSGVGALPATDGTLFGATKASTGFALPLGPSPVATTTLNTAAGCDGITLAVQVNAYTIEPTGNLANCLPFSDDSIGGDPMTSNATNTHNANLDVMSMHLESIASSPVPIPAAAWLFGSGLLGLIGLARRKRYGR
jgi:hypothetical protein